MEVNIKDNEKWSIANVQPSLYKKSVIEDLTTTGLELQKSPSVNSLILFFCKLLMYYI